MFKEKKSVVLLAALAAALPCPVRAWAQQSPEFAYSAEKWASLRDNLLEFGEIPDLVHEYNNTVLQNAISYRDENDKTREDIAQDYYDAADNILSNLSYPDSDDSNFGSGVAAYLNSEIQAEKLLEQGDKSTDDAKTIKLGYDQTEANLVRQAQEQMISYWSQRYSLESLRDSKAQAEADLAGEQARLAAGISTQAQLLSAQQAVSSSQADIQSAESSLAKAKEKLCLMLGWAYGSDVVVGDLPEPDISAICGTDLEADITRAKENNYTLKSTRLQLENARTVNVRDTLSQKLANGEQAVANSVSSAYQELMTALSNYEQAQQAYAVQQTELSAAGYKLQAGTITQNAYNAAQVSCRAAEVKVRTSRLSLLTAYMDYQWDVDGLAAAS